MFSDPQKNVQEFGIEPGFKVADFGSGSGHYAYPISDAVGPNGTVYCIDIKKDVLTLLKNQAIKEGRDNLEVIWGDIDKPGGTKLKDGLVNLVIFSNILFQLDNKEVAIKEAKRILSPKGKIVVIEWSELSFMNGIREDGNKTVLSESELKQIMENCGFKTERSFAAGEHHYGLIFTS